MPCLVHLGVSSVCCATQNMLKQCLGQPLAFAPLWLVGPGSAYQNSKHILLYPPVFGDPIVCNSLFPCELSSAIGFNKPCIKSKASSPSKKIVQIWLSLRVSGAGRLKVASFIFFFNFVHLMKINLIQHQPRGICSLRQPGVAAPRKRSPFLSGFFMAICFPYSAQGELGTFHLVLTFLIYFQSS